jgi:rubrerythrin
MDNSCKTKLVGLLKHALDAEEKAVPVYNRHLESAIFWTGLPEDKADSLKAILRLLADESIEHKVMVDKMLLKLCRGK